MSRSFNRRTFMQYLIMLGVSSQTLMRSGAVQAAVDEAREAVDTPWPKITYRTLGRTGFEGSRLVFGCGAALMRRSRDKLLHAAFDAGVNVFDVGTSRYYMDAEKNLGSFARAKRDRIFLISKGLALPRISPDVPITAEQAKAAAEDWLESLDDSLRELGVDHVDAYYLMAQKNPNVVGNEAFYNAFMKAKQAGKVSYFGLSTHENAHQVLEAAIATGWYDLAQIAITPAGWYSWADKTILPGSPVMTALAPLLARAREAGIGLIGMKAARYLAGRKWLGWGNPKAFDTHYVPEFVESGLSPFQRSYAFVLEHGLDAVNADMQAYAHLKENFTAAATAHTYFA